jgi:NADPH:quinone reductase-like Zn-dependent oxidoreductase
VMNGAGGCERLEYVERPDPAPGPPAVLVEIAVAGVNFMDIGVRQGTIWAKIADSKILGVEGAGRVLAVGRASRASNPASASPGSMRPEALRNGSRFRRRRSCRFPTRSMTARRLR